MTTFGFGGALTGFFFFFLAANTSKNYKIALGLRFQKPLLGWRWFFDDWRPQYQGCLSQGREVASEGRGGSYRCAPRVRRQPLRWRPLRRARRPSRNFEAPEVDGRLALALPGRGRRHVHRFRRRRRRLRGPPLAARRPGRRRAHAAAPVLVAVGGGHRRCVSIAPRRRQGCCHWESAAWLGLCSANQPLLILLLIEARPARANRALQTRKSAGARRWRLFSGGEQLELF